MTGASGSGKGDGRRRARMDAGGMPGVRPLTPAERQVLERAAEAGGRCELAGLPEPEMLQAATTVLELKKRGLLTGRIRFSTEVPGRPEVIPIAITVEGWRCLESPG